MSTEKILPHLKKYIVNQNYSSYTAIDQSTWKFIMKISTDFFSQNAHDIYLEGLKKTGITLHEIPKIKEINKCLNKFGWRAVCVRGFIPPNAFMEFQSLKILPIAADMRSHKNLTYTPSPDIVHEAAGHAPIIANTDYSNYLISYGEIASKAIMSSEDMNLYYAIRDLSDIKEKKNATKTEIEYYELNLKKAFKNISYMSESAILSRMNWWTVEYGLIGNIKNPKIYGAGLLSSVGESENCLNKNIKKIPFDINCIDYNYDITEQQPQLFVTPNFKNLTKVLNKLSKKMSYKIGGISGLEQAKKANTICTIEIDKTLQISGKVDNYISYNNKPIFVKTTGSTQLCFKNKELKGHSVNYHTDGFSTPIGKIKTFNKSINQLSDIELQQLNIKKEKTVCIDFKGNIKVNGTIVNILKRNSKIILITFSDCTVTHNSKILYNPSWGNFDMICGNALNSIYGGPCDKEKYYINLETKEKYLNYNIKNENTYNKTLNKIHQKISKLQFNKNNQAKIGKLYTEVRTQFPNEWLILYEILCISNKKSYWFNEIVEFLETLIKKDDDLGRAIKRGLKMIKQ